MDSLLDELAAAVTTVLERHGRLDLKEGILRPLSERPETASCRPDFAELVCRRFNAVRVDL
jgi:hypothetical protein